VTHRLRTILHEEERGSGHRIHCPHVPPHSRGLGQRTGSSLCSWTLSTCTRSVSGDRLTAGCALPRLQTLLAEPEGAMYVGRDRWTCCAAAQACFSSSSIFLSAISYTCLRTFWGDLRSLGCVPGWYRRATALLAPLGCCAAQAAIGLRRRCPGP
jgi:hypothetical protein